jgi:hypothetical protein
MVDMLHTLLRPGVAVAGAIAKSVQNRNNRSIFTDQSELANELRHFLRVDVVVIARAVLTQKSRASPNLFERARVKRIPEDVSFFWLSMRVGTPRRSGHQIDVDFVELLRVDIELDIGQAQVRRNLSGGVPEDGLSVTRSVIQIDVHVELLLAGNDRRVNQGRASDFVPHIPW